MHLFQRRICLDTGLGKKIQNYPCLDRVKNIDLLENFTKQPKSMHKNYFEETSYKLSFF